MQWLNRCKEYRPYEENSVWSKELSQRDKGDIMDIQVAARISCLSKDVSSPQSSTINYTNNSISEYPGGQQFSFDVVFGPEVKAVNIFYYNIESLLRSWMAGYNVCLIVTGESSSCKDTTLVDSSRAEPGLITLILDYFFQKISSVEKTDELFLSFEASEVYNEEIRDLCSSSASGELKVVSTAEQGNMIESLISCPVSSSEEGIQAFHYAWSRTTSGLMDYGPAQNAVTFLSRFWLTQTQNNKLCTKSKFTILKTSGTESLPQDLTIHPTVSQPTLSRSLKKLNQLAQNLSKLQTSNRNVDYSGSQLTKLLKDEVGGNCKTLVLLCLNAEPEPDILGEELRMCEAFSEVKNFPVVNNSFTMHLLTQYRAAIIHLKRSAMARNGTSSYGSEADFHNARVDNVHLRDNNERLYHSLQQMHNRYGDYASKNTELSSQLLSTEEEKLKVSKALVEMQIENNRIKEEAEQTKFEMTNKILHLENELMEAEVQRDRFSKTAKTAQQRLEDAEHDRKKLADEYVILKTNYINVQKYLDQEQSRNEELSLELMKQAKAKTALMREVRGRDLSTDAEEELDRIKAVVSRLSYVKGGGQMYEREAVEKSLFGDRRRSEREQEQLRSQYEGDVRKVEQRLNTLKKELSEARNSEREKQKKVSELTAQLLSQKVQYEGLQSENNRMQHKLKNVNDEFRSRLVKYVQDIADYVDGTAPSAGQKRMEAKELRKYVDSMLKDLKHGHKVREEQLSQAAQNFKGRAQAAAKKYQELLLAYIDLRQQVQDREMRDIDLGPEITKLQLDDKELVTKQHKTINKLQEELQQLRNEVETLRSKVRGAGKHSVDFKNDKKPDGIGNWTDVRKQLREFTNSTALELEQERAQLLSENALLREQVKELNAYIDSHLSRYKIEIDSLRELLKLETYENDKQYKLVEVYPRK